MRHKVERGRYGNCLTRHCQILRTTHSADKEWMNASSKNPSARGAGPHYSALPNFVHFAKNASCSSWWLDAFAVNSRSICNWYLLALPLSCVLKECTINPWHGARNTSSSVESSSLFGRAGWSPQNKDSSTFEKLTKLPSRWTRSYL